MIGDYKEHTHCTCFVADRRTNYVKDSIDTFDHDWWGEAAVLRYVLHSRSLGVFLYFYTHRRPISAQHVTIHREVLALQQTLQRHEPTQQHVSLPHWKEEAGGEVWRQRKTHVRHVCVAMLPKTRWRSWLENTYDLLKFISKKTSLNVYKVYGCIILLEKVL